MSKKNKNYGISYTSNNENIKRISDEEIRSIRQEYLKELRTKNYEQLKDILFLMSGDIFNLEDFLWRTKWDDKYKDKMNRLRILAGKRDDVKWCIKDYENKARKQLNELKGGM
jgi:hypothetical protein